MKAGYFLFWMASLSSLLLAQEVELQSFRPYQGAVDPGLGEKIERNLRKQLQSQGFTVRSGAELKVQGFYRKGRMLVLYGEIYDSQGNLVDAFTTTEDYAGLADLRLPEEEWQSSDDSIIEEFSAILVRRIKSNPRRKVRSENLEEYALSAPAPERLKTKEAGSEVFTMLEEQFVVTATRSRIRLREAPAAVYVITASDIRARGYKTLVEALHDVPGFDIVHVYGIFPDLIHQRGLVGNNQRTLLYVDGIPDNNITENAFLAGSTRFPLHHVERIEIVSGPASALYGANAFNGIINIITRDGTGADTTRVEAFYGAYEVDGKNPGKGFSLTTGGSAGTEIPFRYNASAYYYQTEGPYFGDHRRLDKPTKDSEEAIHRRFDADYYTEAALCQGECEPDENSIGYYWSPGFNVAYEETYNILARFQAGNVRFETVNWQYLQGDGTFANGTQQIDIKERGLETEKYDVRNNARRLAIANGQVGPQGFSGSQWDFRNNSMAFGYLHEFAEKLSLDSELVVRHTEILSSSREEYPNDPGPYATYTPGDDFNTVADGYSRPDYQYILNEKINYAGSRHESTVGLEGTYTQVPQGYGASRQFVYKNYAFYYQGLWRPFSFMNFTFGYRQDDNSIYGTSHTPRLGLVFFPTTNLTLKFLAGTGFRAPTAWELFNATRQRRANPGLKPEKLRSGEAGIAYRFTDRYYVSLTAFYNEISDLILEVQTKEPREDDVSQNFNQNQNVGEAVIYGSESQAILQITQGFKVHLHHTYSRGNYVNLPGPEALSTSPSTRGRPGDDPLADYLVSEYRSWAQKHPEEDLYLQSIDLEYEPFTGPVPNIPAHKGGVGFTWQATGKLSLHVRHNYVDVRRTVGTNPENTVHGYHWFHSNVRLEDVFAEGLYMQLAFRNMGDARIYDPGIRTATGAYYPTRHPLEGRNVWFTLGYKF